MAAALTTLALDWASTPKPARAGPTTVAWTRRFTAGVQRPHRARDHDGHVPSAVDVAVALVDELAGRGVGVDELRQQREPHGDGDAAGELLPAIRIGAWLPAASQSAPAGA
jgi:hypothetical protein